MSAIIDPQEHDEALRREASCTDRGFHFIAERWFRKHPDRLVRYQNGLVTGDPDKPWFRLVERYGPFHRACSLASGASLVERALMRSRVVEAWDLYDISRRVLRRAKWSMGRHWRRVTTHVADVNRVTLPPDAYDLILCHSALHHFVELERVLDEIARALTADGLLFVWEFVGENRVQWSEARIAFQQGLLDEVPMECRVSPDVRIRPPDTSTLSPFEAVRSADIPALLEDRFRPEFWKTFCGAVVPLFFFVRVDDLERARPDVLERIIRIDRELSENPSPHFVNPLLCALLRRR